MNRDEISIRIDGHRVDVEFTYIPAKRKYDYNNPGTFEIHRVNIPWVLLYHFGTCEQLLTEIEEKVIAAL